ncbi:MAG: 1-acyl-sn-glycerol-3-phosphate acyltransferase [Planctomycetes bacterium]|nr:1-acyl-sn-glycerol-3-phosphate acyltransferase [Planctomycetota bacterium]
MTEPIQHGWRTPVVRAIRMINVAITVWGYTLLTPIGWLGFAVLCTAWRGDPLRRARRLQAIQVRAYRFMHDWLRWCRITHFDHRWPIPGLPTGPCVVIANHPTLMDITAVTAVFGGGCTVVKPSLFHQRLMHRQLAASGHIEGPGRDPISAGRVVEEMAERLRQGFRAIIFPEGTRSPSGELGRFGRLAFEIACRAEVPLVSLAITCEPVYLSKGVPLFRPPHPTAQLRIELLAVDDPKEFASGSRALRSHVESRYRAWLSNLAPAPGRPYSAAQKEREWQNSSRTRSSTSSSTPWPSKM